MKTWNIYLASDWSLIDVVTADEQHQSWTVKDWWLANSMTAHSYKQYAESFDEHSVMVNEPDHMK